jgi:hypothetical protein
MSDEGTRELSIGKSPADVVRAKGWGVGTWLAGDEGFGTTVIRITAVGEQDVLARKVSHKGAAVNEREGSWTLRFRDWTETEPLP